MARVQRDRAMKKDPRAVLILQFREDVGQILVGRGARRVALERPRQPGECRLQLLLLRLDDAAEMEGIEVARLQHQCPSIKPIRQFQGAPLMMVKTLGKGSLGIWGRRFHLQGRGFNGVDRRVLELEKGAGI